MREKTILFFAFIFTFFCCNGQTTSFQKAFYVDTTGSSNSFGDLTIGSDSMFYTIGGYYKAGGGGAYIEKLDKNFNKIWMKTVWDSINNTAVGHKEILGFSSNKMALFRYIADTSIGYSWGTLGFSKVNYSLVDSSGNFLWSVTISDSLPFVSTSDYCLLETADGAILSAFSYNSYETDTTYGVVVSKLNTSGSLIFRKKYELDFTNNKDTLFEARRICELNDGSLVLCGLSWNFIDAKVNGILLKTDADGNVVFCRIFDPTLGEIVDIKQIKNNRFIALSTPVDTLSFNFQTRILELDSSFNIINGITISRPGSSAILDKIYFKNNRLFFTGFPNVLEVDTNLIAIIRAYNYAFGGNISDSKKNVTNDGGLIFVRSYVNYDFSTVTATDTAFNAGCFTYNAIPFLTASSYNTGFSSIIPVKSVMSNSSLLQNFYYIDNSNDTRDTTYCLTTGLNEFKPKNDVINPVIYPNPVMDVLNFTFNKQDTYHCYIYGEDGKNVICKVLHSTQSQIDVSNLSMGFYILKVISSEGYRSYKKFVKAK